MIPTTLFLLATALASTQARNVHRRSSSEDNGSCQALFNICADHVEPSLENVFAIESCLFGASCFGGQHPVDDFLASLYSSVNCGGTAPESVHLARVPSSVRSLLSLCIIYYLTSVPRHRSSTPSAEVARPYRNRISLMVRYISSLMKPWTD